LKPEEVYIYENLQEKFPKIYKKFLQKFTTRVLNKNLPFSPHFEKEKTLR